ncbi:hypothetical protein [Arthrobacter sp. CP30]
MTTALRVLPGLTALTLSFISAYLFATNLGLIFDTASNPQFFFTVSHIGSTILILCVSVAFLLVGRATGCRRSLLKIGTKLLAIASIPVLVANGIYLFSFRSAEASVGDIGGIGLMLLGLVALLLTSLAYTIALPVARPAAAENDARSRSDTLN